MHRRAAVPLLFLVSVVIGLLAVVALSAFAGQQVAPRFSGACPGVTGAFPASGEGQAAASLGSGETVAGKEAELGAQAVAACERQLAAGMRAAQQRCAQLASVCDAAPGCSYQLLTPVYDQCAPATCESTVAEVDGRSVVRVVCTSKGAGAAYCACGGGFAAVPSELGGPGGAAPTGPTTGGDSCNFNAPGELTALMNAYVQTPTAPDGSDLLETVLQQACANKACTDPGPSFGAQCEYAPGLSELAKRCRCPGGSCAPADPACGPQAGGEPPAGPVTGGVRAGAAEAGGANVAEEPPAEPATVRD